MAVSNHLAVHLRVRGRILGAYSYAGSAVFYSCFWGAEFSISFAGCVCAASLMVATVFVAERGLRARGTAALPLAEQWAVFELTSSLPSPGLTMFSCV